MSNPENSPPEPLTKRVVSWLERQGYPLEMRVARVLQQLGAYVVQSDYYRDPTTGTSREIDVVAAYDRDVGDVGVRVSFTIECKGSRHKPWVMFVSDQQRLSTVAAVAQRAAAGIGRRVLWNIADIAAVQELSLFQLPLHCGYSLAPMQDKSTDKDECFTALNGVAAATAAQALVPDQQGFPGTTRDFLEVIFPIIVTDAPLCTAMLDENAALLVEEVKWGVVSWRNPVIGLPHTLVHVVTGESFGAFAEEMVASAGKFLDLCHGPLREYIDEALKSARQSRVVRRTASIDDLLR